MQTVVAKPGEWIRVRVGSNSYPVRIQIGTERAGMSAFVENTRTRSGGSEEVAMRRCPQLPPGTYSMTVTTRAGTIPAKLRIPRP